MMRWVAVFWLVSLLGGCSSPIKSDSSASNAMTDATRASDDAGSANATIALRDAEIAKLKDEVAALKAASQAPIPEDRVAAAPIAAKPPAVAQCFKDYCPCDPPQGGPDMVLCDQIEQGIAVDPQLMIAGRGMREARRQIATAEF